MSEKELTIRDIASEAGVSIATISRYINGKYEYMSQETMDRIAHIIETTGFVPNKMANGLRTKKSDLIGMVTSSISFSSNRMPTVLGSVCDTCAKYGKKVVVVNSNGNPTREKALVRELLEQRVSGLLVFSGDNYEFYRDIDENKTPVVLVDRVPRQSALASVAIDHVKATTTVINRLLEQNYSKIVLLRQPHESLNNTPQIRTDAAVAACRRRFGNDAHVIIHSLEIREDTIADSLQQLSGIIEKYYAQSKRTPTAIFAVEAAVMDALVNLYYRLDLTLSPDFTIAGYGDWKTRALIPNVSTIEQPLTRMGALATERLLDYIDAASRHVPFEKKMEYLDTDLYLA